MAASALFLELIQISLENSKGKEFDGFQIILKLEICAEKIVFNCSTLKNNAYFLLHLKSSTTRKCKNAVFSKKFFWHYRITELQNIYSNAIKINENYALIGKYYLRYLGYAYIYSLKNERHLEVSVH